jgi:hypothetical protein
VVVVTDGDPRKECVMQVSVSKPVAAQKARVAAHRTLIAVEALVAVGAVYGGVGLIADNAIGMPPEWLARTPFTSWVWPGVFLLLVVPMTAAAAAELTRRSFAYLASLGAGAAQIGWIVVQWWVMQRFFFLQPVMFTAGVLVLVLAWLTHRGEPVVPGRHAIPALG